MNIARIFHAFLVSDPDEKTGIREYIVYLVPAHTFDEALATLQKEYKTWGELYLTTDSFFEQAEAADGPRVTCPQEWTYEPIKPDEYLAWVENITKDGEANGKPFAALYKRVYPSVADMATSETPS